MRRRPEPSCGPSPFASVCHRHRHRGYRSYPPSSRCAEFQNWYIAIIAACCNMRREAPSSRLRGGGGGFSGDGGGTVDGNGFGRSTSRRRRRPTLHIMPLVVFVATFVSTFVAARLTSRGHSTTFSASAFFVPMPIVPMNRDGTQTLASSRGRRRGRGRGPEVGPFLTASHPHPRASPNPPPFASVRRWMSPSSGAAAAAVNVTVSAAPAGGDEAVVLGGGGEDKNGVVVPPVASATMETAAATPAANGHPQPHPAADGEAASQPGGSNLGDVDAEAEAAGNLTEATATNSNSAEAAATATNSTAEAASAAATSTTGRIRTASGGFLHTAESRTKISLANKGKIPWNKGRTRTPEERARISAGVRERNRLRLESECLANGMTLEEFLRQKKEEEGRRRADRARRRTKRGGYTPTDETRKKISEVLREKWASGDVATLRRKRERERLAMSATLAADNSDSNSTDTGNNVTVGVARAAANSVPRGPHTEETKEKIRVSLKAKWSEDVEYRRSMTAKAHAHSNSTDVRRRISETLKARWRDPEFRATMMVKIANRKSQVGRVTDEAHKRKISETMRAKWRDPGYRRKALDGMAKKRSEMGITSSSTSSSSSGAARSRRRNRRKLDAGAQVVRPVRPKAVRKKKPPKAKAETEALANGVSAPATKRTRAAPTKKKKSTSTTAPKKAVVKKRKAEPSPSPEPSATTTPALTKEEKRVERMREERKDLYDLLYGSESEEEVLDERVRAYSSSILDEDDEDFDVDNYDPYGLDRIEQSRSF